MPLASPRSGTLFTILALGCTPPSSSDKGRGAGTTHDTDSGLLAIDADGDGIAEEADCDDNDATVGEPTVWFPDADRDGFGTYDPPAIQEQCEAPVGYVSNSDDCDDTDESIHPDAEDTPYDGIDQDCDGDDLTDIDGDGFSSEAVAGGTDCDDTDPSIHPGATESWYDGIDQDCEGDDDYDADADGVRAMDWGDDCDDTNPLAYPEAPERLGTGADEDCDTHTDDLTVHELDWIAHDETDNSRAGGTVALGDLDGDGLDDVVVGAAGITADDTDPIMAGHVYAFFGPSSGITTENNADLHLTGQNDSSAGFSAAVDDLNGDGYEDLLFGAPDSSGGGPGARAGTAHVLLGPVLVGTVLATNGLDVQLPGSDVGDRLGIAVSTRSGVFAVGAHVSHDKSGAAWVFIGVPGTENPQVTDRAWAVVGGEPEDEAGRALLLIDWDGDSTPSDTELLVGAAAHSRTTEGGHRGAVYIADPEAGDSTSLDDHEHWVGANAHDSFGLTISAAGDVDGDGLEDAWIGAINHDGGADNAGAAYLVLGGSTPSSTGASIDTDAALTVLGEGANSRFGIGVAGGDFDGDGHLDVSVGGHSATTQDGTDTGGAVVVVYGPLGTSGGTVDLSGVTAGTSAYLGGRISSSFGSERVGHTMAVGEVDGLPGDDLLVGAYGLYDGTEYQGGAALFMGRTRE